MLCVLKTNNNNKFKDEVVRQLKSSPMLAPFRSNILFVSDIRTADAKIQDNEEVLFTLFAIDGYVYFRRSKNRCSETWSGRCDGP